MTDKISSIVLTRPHAAGMVHRVRASRFARDDVDGHDRLLVLTGIGIWGNNVPVGWAFDIINFVWWIGIGHAGTLISAILLLLRQEWRTSINRFAEAMTLFAVACAGLFPLLHTGPAVGRSIGCCPYPNTMGIWPQFRSPLIWDVFAVSTYVTVSLLFWYVGLIPDLATLRDRAKKRVAQIIYGMLAMGWRGSARHWERYEDGISAAGRTGDAAGGFGAHRRQLRLRRRDRPGMARDDLSALLRGRRDLFRLRDGADAGDPAAQVVRPARISSRCATCKNMAKIMLATGLIVAYGYMMEAFMAWYSGKAMRSIMIKNRMTGPYAPLYWALMRAT